MFGIISNWFLCYLSVCFAVSIIVGYKISKYRKLLFPLFGESLLNIQLSIKSLVKHNLLCCLLFFFTGIIGCQLAFVIVNGLVMGSMISIGKQLFGVVKTIASIIPHGVTEIFGFFMSGCAGFKIFIAFNNWTFADDFIFDILYTLIISILLIIISAIIEIKITPKICGFDIKNIQDIQDIQNIKNIQDIQDIQNIKNIQDIQDISIYDYDYDASKTGNKGVKKRFRYKIEPILIKNVNIDKLNITKKQNDKCGYRSYDDLFGSKWMINTRQTFLNRLY
jgi:uncharacterized membrane protein SpoIIM required for sporulation